MRGVKCFGLLLVFSIIFGLSLSASSDVSALSYDFNSFRLIPYRFVSGSSDTPAHYSSRFDVTFDTNTSSVSSAFDSDLFDNKYTTHYLDGSSCLTSSYSSPILNSGVINNPLRLNIRGSNQNEFYLYSNISNSPLSSEASCRNSSDYASDSLYTSSVDSVTGIAKELINVPKLFLDYNSSADLPNENSGSIRSITLPIDFSMETIGAIMPNTPLSITTGLLTQRPSFPYLDSSPSAVLTLSYFTDESLSSFVTTSINCSSAFDTNIFQSFDDNTLINWSGVMFTCDFTPTTSMRFVHGNLVLSGSGSSGILVTYDYNYVYLATTLLITNNDSTWSGLHANPQPSGSDLTLAPGYEQIFGNIHTGATGCAVGDFECQLSNLFNFNITLNPFYPIFNLFTDQNSCAQIPTLAGMLHSNETQVCPWFDSNTRNIVTPVLGLSSMMLLFGFVVRWLGARSGNFIEDSEGIDSGGLHFQNRFRRGK